MPSFSRTIIPDWLAIIVASKLATTLLLLALGYG